MPLSTLLSNALNPLSQLHRQPAAPPILTFSWRAQENAPPSPTPMPMHSHAQRILISNVRRSSSANFFMFLLDIIREHKPIILILLEASMPDDVAQNVKDRFGFSIFHFVQPMNRHGGLRYFWKYPVQTIDFNSIEPSLFQSLVTLGPNDPKVVLSAIHEPSSSTAHPQF